ncbi:hypothetical protein AB0M80_42360 [Amycolatopsis sp. NPDC051045]|uniref:hypothetical protein n=1 Tax=Amycolatopsis sp. NPDC051045 TaxID=3156922 RepID=UPI00343DCD3C
MSSRKSARDTPTDVRERLIDHWFPCAVVDAAVGSPAGSGRNEKAIFPWFASRPIAQARAAVLATLLPNDAALRPWVEQAVREGAPGAFDRLAEAVRRNYGGRAPVMVDMFSGRGIIPLEAARLGASAVGTDLSPVATFAGRLLADWAMRDWSGEALLPFTSGKATARTLVGQDRLIDDAQLFHEEIGRRTRESLAQHYPLNPDGRPPLGVSVGRLHALRPVPASFSADRKLHTASAVPAHPRCWAVDEPGDQRRFLACRSHRGNP